MSNLLTQKQQNYYLNEAIIQYLAGDYKNAEINFRLVIDSSSQYNDLKTYVTAIVWLERVFVNMSRLEELYQYFAIVNPLIDQYGTKSIRCRHKLNQVLFNHSHRLGDTEQELKSLLNEAVDLEQYDLICTVANNLLHLYVEEKRIKEGIQMYDQVQHYFEDHSNDISQVAHYMHAIYTFELFYLAKDYPYCEKVLSRIDVDVLIVESFCAMYFICKGLLEVTIGSISEAILYFEKGMEQVTEKMTVRFELQLFIDALKERNAYEYVMHYQDVVIQLYHDYYDSKKSNMRAMQLENLTKQHYESQLYIDQLTKVQNRNFYEDIINKQQQVKNYTVFIVDIDHFKMINDRYGHVMGDQILKHISSQLRHWNPKYDISIVRYGGDEFVGLIPYAFEEMKNHLYRLHEQLMNTPFDAGQQGLIPISVTMGIAHTTEQYMLINQLFIQADLSIYDTEKKRGQCIVASN